MRYAKKSVVLLEQKKDSVAIGSKPIVVLVFKSSPNITQGTAIDPTTSSKDNILSDTSRTKVASKLKPMVYSTNKSEAYIQSLCLLIEEVENESNGDDVELAKQLKDQLCDKYGAQWHVIMGKMGEIQVEYTPLLDDYIEVKVGKTMRLIAFRHSQPIPNVLKELFTSVPVLLFLLSMTFLALWYKNKNCVLVPCSAESTIDSFYEMRCDPVENMMAYEACTRHAQYYLAGCLSCIMVSLAVRYTSSLRSKTAKRKWIDHFKGTKFD